MSRFNYFGFLLVVFVVFVVSLLFVFFVSVDDMVVCGGVINFVSLLFFFGGFGVCSGIYLLFNVDSFVRFKSLFFNDYSVAKKIFSDLDSGWCGKRADYDLHVCSGFDGVDIGFTKKFYDGLKFKYLK